MIATGVPKPEIPSSRQPKQKPITTSTTRRSFGRLPMIQSRNASNRPDATAMLYSSRALNTIHMTGHSANTAPAAAASSAMATGNCHTATATISPVTRPARDACQAGRRRTPSINSTTAIGTTASRKDKGRLPATGVSN